jgi:hypothetical protein
VADSSNLRSISRIAKSEEFYDARLLAHDVLATNPTLWEPGYVKTVHEGVERPLEPVYFRIATAEVCGREGVVGQTL